MNYRRYLSFVIACAVLLSGAVAGHEPPPAERAAPLDEAAVGSVSFTNSCAAAVQGDFNRGVALLHSFWFAAAIETFDQVLAADPRCAMAEWGKAMAHWGNPLGNKRDKHVLKQGAEAAARARRLPTGDARERDYIDAVSALYENFESSPDHARAVAFEKAMERLVERYPDDHEATIFFAMALNGSADLTDKTYAQQLRAARILEREFTARPQHPGIAHYLIHSYDVPALAVHALPAARQYASIAPAAPHALHMPSHTFTRLGYWQESIDTNLRSADAALAAGSPAEALHAIDYMVYAYLQTAQDVAAAGAINRAIEIFAALGDGDRYLVAGAFAAAAVPARYALERSDWAAATQVPAIKAPTPFIDAMVHFTHGLGAARSNDPDAARSAVAALKRIEADPAMNAYWVGQVALQRAIVEAWLELALGHIEAALERMREATALQDQTEKSAIAPGPLASAHEQWGDMLLVLDRPGEALAAYQGAMVKEPGRFRAMYGAALAADGAGQAPLARELFARLMAMCSNADGERPELLRARDYLAQVSS